MDDPVSIAITNHPIDELSVLQYVRHSDCGANVLFVGTTRRITGDIETSTLWYEHYPGLAEKELRRLCESALHKWSVRRIAVTHRIGEVPPGESSIAVAISSPHRKDSFEAAEWLMDEIKRSVPIWKKERLANGKDFWVHPGVTDGEKGEEAPMP